MKKTFIVALNLLVLIFIISMGYRFYLNSHNGELVVTCSYEYEVEPNIMNLICDVEDTMSILSIDYPLTLFLYNDEDIIVNEQTMTEGENVISLDSLNFNSSYDISIDGFNSEDQNYIWTNFFEYSFSTARENINIPSFTISELELTDTTYQFDIILTDTDSIVTTVEVDLFDEDDELVETNTITDLSSLTVSYEDLTPENEYSITINITYTINDILDTSEITDSFTFTTQRTLLIPSAEISNVVSNNITLDFTLLIDDEDATSVTYIIELRDLSDVLLSSIPYTTSDISIDITSITSDYYISIKTSYLFNEIQYSDIEIATYMIYNNEYSNFFIIPSLSKVDTSAPLTSYNDYDDYIYTYFDNGIEEFTITCEAPVDCAELVTNELYSRMPFGIIDLVHSFYDISDISYSYTSTSLSISFTHDYSASDITQVNQEVNTILNTIINETMTDYEKILAVHDYIINTTVYDVDCLENELTCDNDHDAIGVLFDHNAVCEGYAHAMDIMLRALRIPTFKVSSQVHQWNAVYYDGTWYHLDATWDDPVTHNGTNLLEHDYFLITTTELEILDDTDIHDFNTKFAYFID